MKKLMISLFLIGASPIIAEESVQLQKLKKEWKNHIQEINKKAPKGHYIRDCKVWMLEQAINALEARNIFTNHNHYKECSEKDDVLYAINLCPADWLRDIDCQKQQDELCEWVNELYADKQDSEK